MSFGLRILTAALTGAVLLGAPVTAQAAGPRAIESASVGGSAVLIDGSGPLPGGAEGEVEPALPPMKAKVSGPLTRSDVPRSYRPGCPVPPGQLRKITLRYWDFQGETQLGSLIARSTAVGALVHVFTKAYAAGFPINRMEPSDAFYIPGKTSPAQSDLRAMRADNTSAFNCRPVTGNPYRMSNHSYGIAIDINPLENPYVTSGRVYPERSGTYLDRQSARPGMILKGSVIARAMASRGWLWGARWSRPDYQHFSANGG